MSSDTRPAPAAFGNLAPEQIFAPESVGELSESLRQAQHDQARLLIAGGATRLAFGNSGEAFDRVLLTRNLNRVIHYEPDDMTLAVEPGCTVAQITDLLAEHGQFIALDVAHPERATIGGSFATGMSGPRRLGGGSLKDWVIGIDVAGVDGVVARAGGMVVKNVTGYDMMHLHYGAFGAFGVVTRLNLKVFPQPGATRSVTLTYRTPPDAHAAAIALLRSQLQPASILVANEGGWAVHARIDAPPSAIDRLVERVVATANETVLTDDVTITDDGAAAVEPFVRAIDLMTGRVVARLPLVATKQVQLMQSLSEVADIQVCADLGSGLVYLTSQTKQPVDEVIAACDAAPTWLALPAAERRGLDVFGPMTPAAAEVVRRLKTSFDPDGMLNPGRFVLGL